MGDIDAAVELGRELARDRVIVPIRYAVVVSVDAANGRATIRPSTASSTDGSQDVVATYLTPTAPAVGAVVRCEVYQGDILILGAAGVDDYPGAPFAEAVGQASVNVSAAVAGTQAITFPAGRFSVAPRLFCQVEGSSIYVPYIVGSPTTSGATVGARHVDNASATNTVLVSWHAIQMTSTTANG